MLKNLYIKYRELIRYIIFGVLTTAVSLGVYFLSTRTFLDPNRPVQLQLANVLSWIAAVSFAYITNRRFVFESRNRNILKEAGAFFLSRLGTLGMDMGLMFLGCTVLKLDDRIMKLIVQAVVLVSNYLLSKFLVFRARAERIQTGKKQYGVCGIYTLLFAVAAAAVFLPFVWNQKSFVWQLDGIWQHFNTFVYLGQSIRELFGGLFREHRLVLPMWDFAIGMGGDIITTLSYYGLGDPFSLLTVFFRPENAELGYAMLILLRMYCAGLAFIAYCKKMGCCRTGTLCGSLAYVFSSFLLYAAVRHPLFTDAMIWLPLVYLGVEKLLRRESPGVYILSIAGAAISNFYFFYMIAILTVLYVQLRGFEAVDRRLGKLLLLDLRAAGLSLIGMAIAAAVFLPSIIAFLGSSRQTDAYSFSWLYPLGTYLKYPKTMIYVTGATEWAYIGVAPIALIGAALEFLRPRKEYWSRILLCLYILFLLFPVFGYIFNGFGYVANRWVFGFTMLMSFLLARNLDGCPLSRTQKLRLCAVIGAYTAIVLFSLLFKKNTEILVSLVLLLLSLLLVVTVEKLPKLFVNRGFEALWPRLWRIAVVTITLVSVVFLGFCRNSPQISNYVTEFYAAGTALDQLEGGDARAPELIDDTGFFRIDSGWVDYINYNFPLCKGVSTTSVYWSILPRYYSEYMVHVNAYNRMLDRFRGMQSRTMLLPFSSAKYYTTSSEDRTQTPYGYTEIGSFLTESDEERILYRTDNVLPLGYTCDSWIDQSAYQRMTSVQRQQAMLQAAVLPDGAAKNSTLRAAVPVFTDYEIPYAVSCSGGATFADHQLTVNDEMSSITLEASCPAGEELYLLIEGLSYQGASDQADITASTEGMAFCKLTHYASTNLYAHGREDYLFNLYTSSEPREQITVTFEQVGVYTFDRIALVSQPMTGFEEALSALREDVMTDVLLDTNRVTGEVSLAKEKVLCLSIPYADGWHLKVDGAPAQLLRVNDLYMGTILSPGTHRIELRYETPCLRMGLFLSITGLVLLVLLCAMHRKRKQKAVATANEGSQ